jgi:hypothetical protein
LPLMTKTAIKRKPRGPAVTRVGPNTEWTDFHGLLKLFGIRRSLAYHLVETGAIKSISLKDKSEKRGKRLFHVPSARKFLNSKIAAEARE